MGLVVRMSGSEVGLTALDCHIVCCVDLRWWRKGLLSLSYRRTIHNHQSFRRVKQVDQAGFVSINPISLVHVSPVPVDPFSSSPSRFRRVVGFPLLFFLDALARSVVDWGCSVVVSVVVVVCCCLCAALSFLSLVSCSFLALILPFLTSLLAPPPPAVSSTLIRRPPNSA
jgi:hypothetical protein